MPRIELLADPGFETGVGWSLLNGAARITGPPAPQAGSYLLSLPWRSSAATTFRPPDKSAFEVSFYFRRSYEDGEALLRVEVFNGTASAFYTVVGLFPPGWRKVTLGPFLFTDTGVDGRLYLSNANTLDLEPVWYVDTCSVARLTGDPAMVSKLAAISNLRSALLAITGAGSGYRTNLGGRVYTVLATPDVLPDSSLPYVCVPLLDEEQTFSDYDDSVIESRWRQTIFAYVGERESDPLETTTTADAANVCDDIVKAVLADLTLAGAVRTTRLVSASTVSGLKAGEPEFAEVVVVLEFTQVFTRDELGI
jgi:hypothetical protein